MLAQVSATRNVLGKRALTGLAMLVIGLSAGHTPLSVQAVAGEPSESKKHWANVPPERPGLPEVRQKDWARNAIDRFTLDRMEADDVAPNPRADRYTLIRRVSLDLIGLPPSAEEAEQFAGDSSPNAFEKVIDRLLASPHFGERWARWWLDFARYADTHGYESDEPRSMWPYRDYVIGAFNRNLPFDRFTIEQVAGDLLPSPTKRQRIATGFHRNTLINTEAGAKEDEFKDSAIKDRVDTTATVWLATTLGCAQCHDHKFEPISIEEYYEFYGFFNNTTDRATGGKSDTVTVFHGDKEKLTQLEEKAAHWQSVYESDREAWEQAQEDWEKQMRRQLELGSESEGERGNEREASKDEIPEKVANILQIEPSERNESQKDALRDHFRSVSPLLAEVREKLNKAKESLNEYRKAHTSTSMILNEGEYQPAHVQDRGNFLSPKEAVKPDVPDLFDLPLPDDIKKPDRMDLARWIVHPENPRTSRVMVNRIWETLFGRGLVKTTADFGVQGDKPTHPKLLDWLATEFVQSGWDMKHLLKTIMMSATYQQSSRTSSEARTQDPYNELLARGPRFRVEAEMIRDIVLKASGLLSHKIGGPSVFPPQPEAVFDSLFIEGGFKEWPTSQGEDRYRRGVYTFVKRTALHPMLRNFDAPNRTVCTVKRRRSNTPLAALNTLNSPAFVEAAGALAHRILEEQETVKDRLDLGFQLCATRPPRHNEMETLRALHRKALQRYENDPQAAEKMLDSASMTTLPELTTRPEAAAWVVVANTLLNMDATLSKS